MYRNLNISSAHRTFLYYIYINYTLKSLCGDIDLLVYVKEYVNFLTLRRRKSKFEIHISRKKKLNTKILLN